MFGIRQSGRWIWLPFYKVGPRRIFDLEGHHRLKIQIASQSREATKQDSSEVSKAEDEEEELEFSLVTGAYRTRKTYGTGRDSPKGLEGIKDLTLRNQDFTLAKLESAGSELYLHFSTL